MFHFITFGQQNVSITSHLFKKPLTFYHPLRKSNTKSKILRKKKKETYDKARNISWIWPSISASSSLTIFLQGTQEPECESEIFKDELPPWKIVVKVITPIKTTSWRNQTTESTAKELEFGAMWWWWVSGWIWLKILERMRETDRGEREGRERETASPPMSWRSRDLQTFFLPLFKLKNF